jgi:hypothetical protein
MTGIHVHAGSSNNNIKNNELVNNEIVVEPDCINNILNNNLPIGKIPIETQTKIPIKTQTKNIPLPSTEFDYDTDGDGVSDGKEIQMHSDPLKKYTFNGLDDFNRLFTYADYNLDSQEKVNEFIIMIPNVKARDSRASEGYSTNIPMPVHDTIPENLNHALDDPIIGYYANKTVFNFDSDGKHGKITVDDEEVLKNGDMTLNGVNPAYYWTHGRPGACGSSTLATLAILRKMGLEAHMVAGTSLEGEFIMLDRAGHRWVEFNYEGNEYVSNFGEIRPKAEWYSKSKWTNATGDAPDFVI